MFRNELCYFFLFFVVLASTNVLTHAPILDESYPLFHLWLSPLFLSELHSKAATPPLNVVCVGSAQDSETAKQTVLGGVEAGVFTYNFTNLLKTKPRTTFKELETFMKKQIARYQSIMLTASSNALYATAIIRDED